MSAYSWACQEALYAKLIGDAALAAFVGERIYDAPPQTVVFPWLEMGDRQLIPDDTSTESGASDAGIEDNIDLHIWSRYSGKKEVLQIVDTLHTLLHGVSLTIAGRASALAWVQPSPRIMQDPDGLTYHGIVPVMIVHRS